MTGTLCAALALAAFWSTSLSAQKFYPDDPILAEPRPRPARNVTGRKLSEYYDFFNNHFFTPGERHPPKGPPIPSQAVNTLGEVPDSGWYTNRHWPKPMTIEELVRGPGNRTPPSSDGPWKVVAAKAEGVTPGFTMLDTRGRRYFVKFDPLSNPEMASAADVISSKFFHALGYQVPENYIAYFRREQLVVAPDTRITDAQGKHRPMTSRDIEELLLRVPRHPKKGYRLVASLQIPGRLIGPFRYHGVRADDPNDVVRHEHRRDLRGMYVFAAWLGHNDVKSLNSLDTVVEDNGVPYIQHFLIDFGAGLGSDSFAEKSPRAGYEYLFAFKPSMLQLFTAGLHVPRWARADYPDIPAAGNLEWEIFDPEKWKPNYRIPAFHNRLPGDVFWAARQVAAFTDDEIRAIVATGEFSDPRAAEWIARCLIGRRDKIGRAYLGRGLPLDRFRVSGGRLEFDDLAVQYLKAQPQTYRVQWSRFDNHANCKTELLGESRWQLPRASLQAPDGEYFSADIAGSPEARQRVTVYLRKQAGQLELVGVDRIF